MTNLFQYFHDSITDGGFFLRNGADMGYAVEPQLPLFFAADAVQDAVRAAFPDRFIVFRLHRQHRADNIKKILPGQPDQVVKVRALGRGKAGVAEIVVRVQRHAAFRVIAPRNARPR